MAVANELRREDLCNIKVADIVVPEKRLRFYEAKRKWREIDLPNAVIVTLKKYWKMLDKKDQSREYLFTFVGRTAYTHFNNWCREKWDTNKTKKNKIQIRAWINGAYIQSSICIKFQAMS